MDVIKIFNTIRDIPYHCPESLGDSDYRCWGKNRLLFYELKKNGYEVRYRVCDFDWFEQKIPKEITSKAPNKIDRHLFVEVKLDDRWTILDCSNDSMLPSFNNWDGKSDCDIAVKYSKIYSTEESEMLERQERENFQTNFFSLQELYVSINKFFDQIRK